MSCIFHREVVSLHTQMNKYRPCRRETHVKLYIIMSRTSNDIKQLASKNGYDYVETTSELTGYPRDIEAAITGFENFDEAQDFADKNGLRLVLLTKRNGWDFWTGRTNWLQEAPEVNYEDFGGIEQYDKDTDEDDLVDNMKSLIDGMDEMSSIKEVVEAYNDILSDVQELGEDQMVVVFENLSHEVYDRHPMSWNYDTHDYIIAAVGA